jgi:GT2 family glycosyltransferase
MKVIAVVVTYNRCALLLRTLEQLRKQTRPLEHIIVVNNGSSDGTADALAAMSDIEVVTQENSGGSGGFYTGMQRAYKAGADWVWCMDDDVFPADDCLDTLLRTAAADTEAAILAPRRWMDNTIVCHDFTAYNLTRFWASMYRGRIAPLQPETPTRIVGTAFEGPLIRRDVITTIGLPRRELFIFCDDTDYCLRAHLAGFALLYVPTARLEKERFFSDDSWSERERKKKWKRYYQVRNATFLNHHYGRNWGVRYLRGFIGVAGYILTATVTAPFARGWTWGDIPRLWHAYRDGIAERLGKM